MGVEDELRKLQRTMSRVQDLVDHVKCYPLRLIGGSKAWKIWFTDMKNLSYDADSLVDYISLHISTSGSIPQAEIRNMILSSCAFQLPHEINALQNKLEDLAKEMKSLLIIEKMKVTREFGIYRQRDSKKCKGLPLAAEMLGSLLSNSESTENEWHGILKSKLWDFPKDDNDLFPSLMLIYLQFPPQLQICFAYCSLFPQNYEFEMEELVLLWMAEGFIQGWRLEDLRRHYFNDLYSRSLFQHARNSRNQIIYRCDLIHDMTQMVSTDICLQVMNVPGCCPLFGDTCHLSMFHNRVKWIHLRASQKNKRLRTFLMINKRSAQGGRLDNELFAYLQFCGCWI